MLTHPAPSLNPLLLDTGSPPIPEVHAWAARYPGAAGPMLDMCQAAPGHPPAPELLARLAHEAGQPGNARYGAIIGDPALRKTYAAWVSETHAGHVGADQVAITAGCNQAFTLAMMAVAQRGDRVVLPAPWYWNHKMTLDMLGIDAVPLPCSAAAGFVPDPDAAEALLDGRTRALVLITPNNPTGAVYPPEVIAAFQALCRRRGVWLVLDETYRDLLPTGQPRGHDLFADPAWSSSLIGLYSFSKAFAIPGHRLGAIMADASLMTQFYKVLDCLHVCPGRTAQAAITWAIPALQGWRAAQRVEVNARAGAMRAVLSRLPGWEADALGAYFAYVRHPFPGVPAAQVAERLAVERGVMCLPGPAFGPGQDGHLRLAFAGADVERIRLLPERLGGLA